MIRKEVATISGDSLASTRLQAWQSSRTALRTAAARSAFREWSTKSASDTLRTGDPARIVTRTTSRTLCAGLPFSTRLVILTWTTGRQTKTADSNWLQRSWNDQSDEPRLRQHSQRPEAFPNWSARLAKKGWIPPLSKYLTAKLSTVK